MKAGRICQILRSLILQYCTMNIPIRSMGVTEGNAGGKVGGPFFNKDSLSCVDKK